MKLRGNKLKPLRFDSSGAWSEAFEITQHDCHQMAKKLETFRDSIVANESALVESSELLEKEKDEMSSDSAFYGMPKRLLLEYGKDRFGSELARLFKVANRFHATVDRVVILGTGGSGLCGKPFMDGCCQPFWNELSRGARGSKPRIYFHENALDNDATQGLLNLLGAHEGRPSMSEQDAWGIVVVGESGELVAPPAALLPLVRALDVSCGGDTTKLRQRFIAVTRGTGKLRRILNELQCEDIFPIPDFVSDRVGIGFATLSAVGLVPAALLGVNVIELLLGAVAMNEHFEKKTVEENIILQSVAVNHLLATRHDVHLRVMSIWSKALESVGVWYQRLVESQLERQRIEAATSVLVSDPRMRQPYPQDYRGRKDRVFHNLIVDDYRFDHLSSSQPIGLSQVDFLPIVDGEYSNEMSDVTFPQRIQTAVTEVNEGLRSRGFPSTSLLIPIVDELHLGQLLQMLMIATLVESRIHENPPKQSDS